MTKVNKEITNETIETKKAVIYRRVSDPGQLKGISIDVQKDLCEKWANQNNFKIIEVYTDEAKTGTKTIGRKGLEDAIIRCQQEHIDVLLTIDTDRFARNEIDHYFLKDELRKQGTKIIAVNQPMIDDSPEGRLMENMLIGINAFYSRLTGRKVRKSLENKWEQGWWPGWAPLGYLNVNIGNEDRPNRVIKIDPVKGPLIAEMFQIYSTGNYSFLRLTHLMHEKGLTARKGKRLSVGTAQQIIANPFYYGLMKWSGMQKIGRHDPLINDSLYQQCQYVAGQHRQFVPRIRIHTFLLRGIVKCPIHGRWLTAEWHDYHKLHYKKHKIGYYHCTNVGGCPKSYIETWKLEKMVAKQFKKYQFSEKFINFVAEAVKQKVQEDRGNVNSKRQGLVNEKKAVEEKRDRLEDLLIKNIINEETYKRQHFQLQNEIDQIDIRILNIQNEYNLDIHLIEDILSLTRNISKTYLDAPDFLKGHLLRFFFENIYFSEGKITKIVESPIFSTLRKENHLLIRSNWLPR